MPSSAKTSSSALSRTRSPTSHSTRSISDRDPDAKLAARREHGRPIFDELVARAEIHQPFEAPSSKLGEAIRYLLNHRVALGRFIESGLVPIDNGKVERLHIRAALARKDFLFAGNDEFGERAAIAFTILGRCRIVGLSPVEYLADDSRADVRLGRASLTSTQQRPPRSARRAAGPNGRGEYRARLPKSPGLGAVWRPDTCVELASASEEKSAKAANRFQSATGVGREHVSVQGQIRRSECMEHRGTAIETPRALACGDRRCHAE